MYEKWRGRRQLATLRPGDGSALPRYRAHQLFTRSLFFLELVDDAGEPHVYAVDVRLLADSLSDMEEDEGDDDAPQAALYLDGVQTHRADVPATFPVPDGMIQVATSLYGLKRMHHVSESGAERTLQPHRSSQEGLRARFANRFPRWSSAIGLVAILVLLVGLVVGIPQALELITQQDRIAEQVGTFTSPIQLPGWADVTLLVAGILAATERALTLRNHWLVDADTTWSTLG
ncbi:hypothetical protein ACHAAC_03070 [Aeromicrobium sp. CF4.19]|uniref:hypothetical protein n=1 Tax=Aeromicrobium sp. CF4.19 TaxID=3373082 RepID=UPI003EE81893